jgi:hypothetical protein
VSKDAWNDEHVADGLDFASLPLDGTMGDHFDEASLNARWSRRNINSGWETYQSGGGSWLRTLIQSATVPQQYFQTCPAGDWAFIAAMTFYAEGSSAEMFGLVAFDSSGNGRGPVAYRSDTNSYHGVFSGGNHVYSSNGGGLSQAINPSGRKIWYYVDKVGTTIGAKISTDGQNWSKTVTATDSRTFDNISIGRVFGSGTDTVFCVDLFDRIA